MLDIHPQPDHSRVEIHLGDRHVSLGRHDETEFLEDIHAARNALSSVVEGGYFAFEEERVFEFLYHFNSVDECETYMDEHKWGKLEAPIVARAKDFLTQNGGEVVLREPIRAARLRRM